MPEDGKPLRAETQRQGLLNNSRRLRGDVPPPQAPQGMQRSVAKAMERRRVAEGPAQFRRN